jgi:hypothetical protein
VSCALSATGQQWQWIQVGVAAHACLWELLQHAVSQLCIERHGAAAAADAGEPDWTFFAAACQWLQLQQLQQHVKRQLAPVAAEPVD